MNDVEHAEIEQRMFAQARLSPLLLDEGAISQRRLHNIPEQQKLQVANELMQGEILYRKGEYEQAFAALKRGVHLDDNLPFDEPVSEHCSCFPLFSIVCRVVCFICFCSGGDSCTICIPWLCAYALFS